MPAGDPAGPDYFDAAAGRIRLSAPDSAWPELYRVQERRIRAALGAAARAVEHVGSTSVPGLSAKDCLDVLLIVADPADEPAYRPALEAAGYRFHLAEPDWHQHRLFTAAAPQVNLHVFAEGPEPDRMRLFRDHLRTHPADRDRYEQAKRSLAERSWPAVQAYADAKSAVVEEILDRAAGTGDAAGDPGGGAHGAPG